MSKSVLVSASLTLLTLIFSTPSNAESIVDNLNNATTDGLWGLYGSSDYSISTGSQGVTINYTSGTVQPAGENGGIYSEFGFDGDFTLSVKQSISGLPTSSGAYFENGGPNVNQSQASSFVGPFNTITGPVTEGSVFENGVYIGSQNYPLSSEINTIKIERVGNTMFEFIAPDGTNSFTPLFSAAGDIFNGATSLTLGYFVQGTTSTPSGSITYSDFSVNYGVAPKITAIPGGSQSDPTDVPNHSIDEITGDIGGPVPESYFRFHWDGGAFNAVASLNGESPASSFLFQLLGGATAQSTLSSADYFTGNINYGDLVAGNYAIGLTALDSHDPAFQITFSTPIFGVPEPGTWSMIVAGFGGLGAVMRTRRWNKAVAAA
jgi:hypothetical protein